MKKTRRTLQVSDVLQSELSMILRRDLTDPDLGFVTVTGVEVSPDLRQARVFVSTLGAEEQQQKSMAALAKATTKIRHLVSQRASLRHTPELEFRNDTTMASASSIEKILQEVLPEKKEGAVEPDDHEDE